MVEARYCAVCGAVIYDASRPRKYCSLTCSGVGQRRVITDSDAPPTHAMRQRFYERTDRIRDLPFEVQLAMAERAQQSRPSYVTWRKLSHLACRCTGAPIVYQAFERIDDDDEMEYIARSIGLALEEAV